jgi:hypothetical protein
MNSGDINISWSNVEVAVLVVSGLGIAGCSTCPAVEKDPLKTSEKPYEA